MKIPAKPCAPAERRLSLILLGLLAATVGMLLAIQPRYDLGQWREQPYTEITRPAALPNDLGSQERFPDSLRPLSPPEYYHAVTLSDKIDGKAEFYLSAGFIALETRRFSLISAEQNPPWLERFVYDMGRRRNAFAVFSGQRRGNQRAVDFSAEGYASSNGIFFVHDRYYVEIIASDEATELQSAALAMARRFIDRHPDPGERLIEPELFDGPDLMPESIALIPANAFGLEKMNWIFTARYQKDSNELLAFISRRENAAEAEALAKAFADYFIEYGGQRITPPNELAAARIVEILGGYEIIYAHGSFIFGVHEAADKAQALAVTNRLRSRVKEIPP
jgi:hypothetical protein